MRRPIRILFTVPNFVTAGSGAAMLAIVERLDRSRFAPAVCVERRGGRLDAVVGALGIPFIEAPFRVASLPRARFMARAWRAAGAFRSHRFDLWHSFHYGDDYSEPVIARLAGARAWIYTKKNMSWHAWSWHVRSTLASAIVAQNTDMMRDFFTPARYRRKTRLVPRGVDTRRFRPGVTRTGLRAIHGIPEHAALAVCVAHLLPVKGHPTLLRAAARVPDLHVALAGREADAAYSEGLRREAEDLGIRSRVHFLGSVDDVPGLLAEADLAVLPTVDRFRMEGCPVALLEAMASGVPSVATDVPGSRDLIGDGECGILVPPEDPVGMAAALQRLSADPELRRRLGRSARLQVESAYTIEREVADHEEIYAGLA